MDSPVIVDNASEFGRGIDLDRESPGFPFNDESGHNRHTDIRSHLDDLAARHPEFADHLLGPAWDIPFQRPFRNLRRDSGQSSNSYQSYPDEDARSQASGSSAASGASGVSSHGDPQADSQQESQYDSKKIPQYGLRNTVDIGQHHHNMENSDKGSQRGQRSMSAPPENRQQQSTDQQQQQPQGQQRYVSRVEITPQQQREKSPAPSKPQQQQQQGNVRQIPIFVEGRDEPIISKDTTDESTFQRQPSPPSFRKSYPFAQNFGSRHNQGWPPEVDDFFSFPQNSPQGHGYSSHQPNKHQQFRYHPQPYQQETTKPKDQTWPQDHQDHVYYPGQAAFHQPHPQQQYRQQHMDKPRSFHFEEQHQQQPQAQETTEPPKPKPPAPPKDPLERVALVQKEVDSLALQVQQYTGHSRKDKQYMYLDEMLTRELIKLDDIETEGKENVRQARKKAIKSIQDSISLLESKAPLPGQQQTKQEESQEQQSQQEEVVKEEVPQISEKKSENVEVMETEQQHQSDMSQQNAIPLPPCSLVEPQTGAQENEITSQKVLTDPTNSTIKVTELPMEVSQVEKSADGAAAEAVDTEENREKKEEPKDVSNEEEKEKGGNPQQEGVNSIPHEKETKSPKKNKKTKKKPQPVSEEAIPLPAPQGNQSPAK